MNAVSLVMLCAAVSPPVIGSPGRAAATAYADLKLIDALDEQKTAAYEALKEQGKAPKVAYQAVAPYIRYLWLSCAPERRADTLLVLKVHLNLLSLAGFIYDFELVDNDLIRIDVRGLYWDANNFALEAWEKTAETDVIFHQPASVEKGTVKVKLYSPIDRTLKLGKKEVKLRVGPNEVDFEEGENFFLPHYVALPKEAIDGLRGLAFTESPILCAEWFFVQSARQVSIRNELEGTGYNDFLGLKTRDDFFKITGTDAKKAREIFAVWRAVATKKQLSQQVRMVGALGSAQRRAWFTLDTKRQKGKGVLLRNLREGEFLHDAEEWYGFLPNGLWVTALVQAKADEKLGIKAGDIVASAPDFIGPDDSPLNKSRDHRVHSNLSCIRCHGNDKDMLKPVDDWARRRFRDTGVFKLVDPEKKVEIELKSEYLRDIQELLEDDRILYVRGLSRATRSQVHPKGLTTGQFAKLYAKVWDWYVQDNLTSKDAARELGVSHDTFMKNLKAYFRFRGASDNVLAAFLDEPEDTIDRLDWEDSYAFAMTIGKGLASPEKLKEEKKVDPFKIDPK